MLIGAGNSILCPIRIFGHPQVLRGARPRGKDARPAAGAGREHVHLGDRCHQRRGKGEVWCVARRLSGPGILGLGLFLTVIRTGPNYVPRGGLFPVPVFPLFPLFPSFSPFFSPWPLHAHRWVICDVVANFASRPRRPRRQDVRSCRPGRGARCSSARSRAGASSRRAGASHASWSRPRTRRCGKLFNHYFVPPVTLSSARYHHRRPMQCAPTKYSC